MPQLAPPSDFIEVYANAMDERHCEHIIRRFEDAGTATPGRVGSGVFPDLKHSDDIHISGQAAWADVEQMIGQAVFAGVLRYLRRYPHLAIAPLMLEMPDGAGGQRRLDAAMVESMSDAELSQIVGAVFRPGTTNLQRYRADQGGYPYWHCELYPKDASCETLHRTLLWTIYLNDGFADGETEFLYQARRIVPATGALLLAPTAFTHTHRGNRPRAGDKYIATGWVLFSRAEALYASAP